MFGIIIGTLCLIGFIAVWRRRHGFGWHRHPGYPGYGCGPGGLGGHRWARRWGLYRVLEELDTSPGQEKAIRGALGELRAALTGLRPQLVDARQSLAAALVSESFDGSALERSVQGRLAELAGLGPALAASVGKIHEALDADQRKRLARLVDALPLGRAF